jgi:hypothetical protein
MTIMRGLIALYLRIYYLLGPFVCFEQLPLRVVPQFLPRSQALSKTARVICPLNLHEARKGYWEDSSHKTLPITKLLLQLGRNSIIES